MEGIHKADRNTGSDLERISRTHFVLSDYHNIFSLDTDDRPTDFVIDYDILLDDWLKRKEFKEKHKGKIYLAGKGSNVWFWLLTDSQPPEINFRSTPDSGRN